MHGLGLPTDPAKFALQEWHACVASAEFFFNDVQNESFAELLREKKRWYEEQVRRLTGRPAAPSPIALGRAATFRAATFLPCVYAQLSL
jgi:hypothetical protein